MGDVRPPAGGGAGLALVFAAGWTQSPAAWPVYAASVYALAVWAAALPGLVRRLRAAVRDSGPARVLRSTQLGRRYLDDAAFRGGVALCRGMAVNFLYALFRITEGIRYRSVWFISLAVYDLMLGAMRAGLAAGFRRREALGLSYEYRCYRRTGYMLFLLNIPMGGMIVLMVHTNSGFSYPGYVIYLSALYTFYRSILSVAELVRFRALGSPILSAAKTLDLVSAMMSLLGLQTAMIARFSSRGEAYRQMMNALTGGAVYAAAAALAAYMLLRAAAARRRGRPHGQG